MFNGIALFSSGATSGLDVESTLTVVTSHDGAQTVGITQADLDFISTSVGTTTGAGMDIGSFTGAQAAVAIIQTAIQNLATIRANNGAEQSRLTFAPICSP